MTSRAPSAGRFLPAQGKVLVDTSFQVLVSRLAPLIDSERFSGSFAFNPWSDPGDISLVAFPQTAMAAHSSTLAWKIPWMEEPGGLQSMGSLRVGHDWSDLAAAAAAAAASHYFSYWWQIELYFCSIVSSCPDIVTFVEGLVTHCRRQESNE